MGRSSSLVESAEHGPCLGAEDDNACMRELQRFQDNNSLVLGQSGQIISTLQLSTTRGGEILRVTDARSLPPFLGTIDTAGEARVLVASRNFSPLCEESGSLPQATCWSRHGSTA
jgi:hypothetical protein